MTRQPALFGDLDAPRGVGAYGQPREPIPPNYGVDPRDRPRLSRQSEEILARLRRGPATNADLSKIALKYTGRLSEIRQAGYTIVAERGAGGLWTYTLIRDNPAVEAGE